MTLTTSTQVAAIALAPSRAACLPTTEACRACGPLQRSARRDPRSATPVATRDPSSTTGAYRRAPLAATRAAHETFVTAPAERRSCLRNRRLGASKTVSDHGSTSSTRSTETETRRPCPLIKREYASPCHDVQRTSSILPTSRLPDWARKPSHRASQYLPTALDRAKRCSARSATVRLFPVRGRFQTSSAHAVLARSRRRRGSRRRRQSTRRGAHRGDRACRRDRQGSDPSP